MDLRDVEDFMQGRRAAPVPQLSCVNGPACSRHAQEISAIQCRNVGADDLGEVQWRCDVDLDSSLRLGEINVNCEGYSSRTDRLKLRGSCGLEYSLHYTTRRHFPAPSRQLKTWIARLEKEHGQVVLSPPPLCVHHYDGMFPYSSDDDSLAFWILIAVLIGIGILVCMRERSSSGGASGGSGAHGGRPPPYNPDAHHAPPPPYSASHAYQANNGFFGGANGFWTGAAIGGTLASLFGGRQGGELSSPTLELAVEREAEAGGGGEEIFDLEYVDLDLH
ncbi:hypothetical protein GUITHDRAFT_142024 [Guillardia theta CCMP2712]|uniref:Store-operated calcium entry-associated regulatory factor n=1 Tax=Guillardia theta (strain CCMP2712) TaxID=905079 RepID=L1IZT1_GUITC|nr:hypothetical protein GUITHDRAFT_142024 [Guillardia theta CCMP2712]EKX41315.1 hypothetical protein GUITHDRAFT_142024 [Guillardia theta CCMP2712]|eukprot:XP_005828295.1 hypothetical protein GUITHDRAFT_142024 [Guillardia theta CCMP2712]